ncbi:cytochrome P450 [Roseomonas stagni]|uniref:Cytochrome P450 n=1 Tax=Falsiroseomonas algicola TaxID=2716930 RepID=A0A6M1LHR9_9PROT|nr:cytochrome P450 [Falsiroseomonas algicola]NGM19898.1 cytochrome P450 [Falsiroseomonas algicola]
MTGCPVHFDLLDPAIQADPHAAYAALRQHAPVHRLDRPPMWLVTRHAEVEAVLRDAATFASDIGMDVPIMSMVMKDAPDHTRLRGTVNKAFTPRAIQHLAPRITAIAEQLAEALPERAEMVEGFANPLSVTVICEMLGVPLDQRDAMNRYARDALLAGFAATGMGPPELLAEARIGLDALMRILDAAIEDHLAHPRDDILGTLVQEEAHGTLTRVELRNLCALLLIGGHETTANLIASGLHWLARDAALFARLRAQPDLIPRFVEELARLLPPLQRIARRTTRAVTLGGTALPEGAMLMLFPGAANRDEARWPAPDTLDLARDNRGHLGFGTGIHTCPGGPLARLEARIAFEALLARLDGITLDPARKPQPIVGYAAGNLGWNTLPLLLRKRMRPVMVEDVFGALRALVAETLEIDAEDITAGTNAKTTPEWDSLGHMRILAAVEKRFGVKLPRLAAYRVKDVGELAALIETTQSQAGA